MLLYDAQTSGWLLLAGWWSPWGCRRGGRGQVTLIADGIIVAGLDVDGEIQHRVARLIGLA